MELPVNLSLRIPEVTDTAINKMQQIVISKYVATNQYDEAITYHICNTVVYVCLCICIAVVLCFLIVVLLKMYSKNKDFKLEKESLIEKDKIWNLKKQLEDLERNHSLEKNEWIMEKNKELWKLTQEKDKELSNLTKEKDILEIKKDRDILEIERKSIKINNCLDE